MNLSKKSISILKFLDGSKSSEEYQRRRNALKKEEASILLRKYIYHNLKKLWIQKDDCIYRAPYIIDYTGLEG